MLQENYLFELKFAVLQLLPNEASAAPSLGLILTPLSFLSSTRSCFMAAMCPHRLHGLLTAVCWAPTLKAPPAH